MKISLLAQGRTGVWTSSSWIRFIIPFQASSAQSPITPMTPQEYFRGNPASEILVVQRCALENYEEAERILESTRVPIVLDTDDDFLDFPESHPEYEKYMPKLAAHKLLAQNAQAISVTSERLRQTYSALNANVKIVRNGIHLAIPRRLKARDALRSQFVKSTRLKTPFGPPLRILYHGTKTHSKDLDLFLPALERIAGKVKLRLDLVGVTSKTKLPDFIRVVPVPRGQSVYPKFMKFLLSLGPYDFGIAPLLPTNFNESKSDIKILEYLAVGAHPVVSNVGSYRDWEHGVSKIDHPLQQIQEIMLTSNWSPSSRDFSSNPLMVGRDSDSKRKEWMELFSTLG